MAAVSEAESAWSYYQSDQVSVWLGLKRDIRTLICSCIMFACQRAMQHPSSCQRGGFQPRECGHAGPLAFLPCFTHLQTMMDRNTWWLDAIPLSFDRGHVKPLDSLAEPCFGLKGFKCHHYLLCLVVIITNTLAILLTPYLIIPQQPFFFLSPSHLHHTTNPSNSWMPSQQ